MPTRSSRCSIRTTESVTRIPQSIWTFLTEGEFWKASPSNRPQVDLARGHIAFLLERALEDKLVTHRDVVEGVTVQELANRLPKIELGQLIQCALQNAQKGTSFTGSRPAVDDAADDHSFNTFHCRTSGRPSSFRASRSATQGTPVPPRFPRRRHRRPPSSAPAAAIPATATAAHYAAAAPVEPAKSTYDVPFPAPAPGAKGIPSKSKDSTLVDSKVKLKQPAPEAPGVHKVEEAFFGDEADDIEVIEEETQKTG